MFYALASTSRCALRALQVLEAQSAAKPKRSTSRVGADCSGKKQSLDAAIRSLSMLKCLSSIPVTVEKNVAERRPRRKSI